MEYGILFLLIIVILCYIQTLLSQSENKFSGLIIPFLSFIASIVYLFVLADEFNIIKALFTLVFTNIPTYIFILIYYFKQKKVKK